MDKGREVNVLRDALLSYCPSTETQCPEWAGAWMWIKLLPLEDERRYIIYFITAKLLLFWLAHLRYLSEMLSKNSKKLCSGLFNIAYPWG